MSIAAVLVYVVTILVAGIVALTYLKPHLLQPQEHPDQLPPKIHLYAGAAGLVVWILFLVSPPSFFLGGDVPGVIGLFGIWLAAIAGTYLLVRRLKEQRAAGHVVEDAYGYDDGYDDGYGEEYAAEDGYAYDEAGYGEAGYAEPGYAEPGYAEPGYAQPGYAQPGYNEYGEVDERSVYADPQQAVRRPEPRRAAPSVEETAVMAPVEREPSPAPPPAPAPAPARGSSSRSGQIGRRVAGRQAPEPPAPEAPVPAPPAPAPPRRPRPAPERPRQERPAPEPPAPERPAPRQPDPGAPGRSQDGQDPWGRRQDPPQRRPRGYDGRYDDRRNESHDEFADRRYRRDSSYPDYPGQQQPTPPRAPRPAPQPAPQPAPPPAPAPAPAPPPPPQAPRQQSGRRAGEQQPEAYDPYSLESYGPRGERPRDQAPPQAPAQAPAQVPAPAQPGRRQPDQGYYDEQAYAGYEQGFDDAHAQGYGYDQAYDGGYDDRYDDAYDRSVGGRRSAVPERDGSFFDTSGAAILAHITLVILAIWLTWAYGTSVI